MFRALRACIGLLAFCLALAAQAADFDTTKRAAEAGDAQAQFSLGVMYHNGEGVPQNDAEAMKWSRKAADQGNAPAQNNLGVMYANGQGVPGNNVIAYALWNLAAAQESASGNHDASNNRSKLVNGMTAQAIEAGQALSRQMGQPGNLFKALDSYRPGPNQR